MRNTDSAAADWLDSQDSFTDCGLVPEGPFMSKLKPKDFNAPAILLGGPVDYDVYKDFRAQLDRSTKEGLVVTELSTLGGDPEVARMMGEDIRFHSENSLSMPICLPGKGGDLLSRDDLHELFRSREPISYPRYAVDDS